MMSRSSAKLIMLGVGLLCMALIYKGCSSASQSFNAFPPAVILPGQAVGLSSFTPGVSMISGGTTVSLSGTNFEAGSGVSFGGTASGTVTFISTTQLEAVVPAHAAGTVSVGVATPNHGSASLGGFLFVNPAAPPDLTSIAPNTGGESGGTSVTIVGSNFDGATAITIDGRALLNQNVVNPSTITGKTPPMDPAQSVPFAAPVIGTNLAGASVANLTFTYNASVVITSIAPSQGPYGGGTTVTITGRNFQDSTGANTVVGVNFGGKAATNLNVLSDTQLSVRTPARDATLIQPVDVEVFASGNFGSDKALLSFTYGPLFVAPTTAETTAGGSPTFSGPTKIVSAEAIADTFFVNPHRLATLSSGAVFFSNEVGEVMATAGTSVTVTGGVDLLWTSLDGDSTPDLVVLSANGLLTVFLDGDPLTPSTVSTGQTNSTSLAALDYDDDNNMDIAVIGGLAGNVRLNLVPGDGAGNLGAVAFTIDPGVAAGHTPLSMTAAEPDGAKLLGITDTSVKDQLPSFYRVGVDRDAHADLVLVTTTGPGGTGEVYLLTGDGAGGFTTSNPTPTLTSTQEPLDMVLTDFDKDLRIDVLILYKDSSAGADGVKVLRGGVNASNLPVLTPFPDLLLQGGAATTPLSLAAGDFNDDCRDDLAVANTVNGGNVVVYLSRGGGYFGSPVNYVARSGSAGVSSIAAVTAGRDGDLFVAEDNTAADAVVKVRRVGTLAFEGDFIGLHSGLIPPTGADTLTAGTGARSVKLADLDGDGDADLLVANFSAGTLTIRFNTDGRGNFGNPTTISVPAGPRVMAVEDLDGVNGPDIVVVHQRGPAFLVDQVSVHFNNGTGSFISPFFTFDLAGKEPRDVVLADLVGDSRLDIATLDQSTNSISVLANNTANRTSVGVPGASDFNGLTQVPTGNSPSAFVVANMGRPETGAPAADLAPDTATGGASGQLNDFVVTSSSDDTVSIIYNGVTGGASYNTAAKGLFGLTEAYPLGGVIEPDREGFNMGGTGTPSAVLRGIQASLIPVEPIDVETIDMNGDGFRDIIVLEQQSSSVTILHANASERVFAPVVPGSPDAFEDTTGDVQGNLLQGQPWLGGSGSIRAEELVRSTPTTPLSPGGSPNMPPLLGANGAGIRKYFLPTDYRTNGVSLASVTDIGLPRVVLPVASNPQVLRIGDTNADGRPDIVVGSGTAGVTNGLITVYTNFGSDFQGGVYGPSVTPATPLDPPVDPPYFPEVLMNRIPVPAGTVVRGETTFRFPARVFLTSPVPGYSVDDAQPTFASDAVGAAVIDMDLLRINRDCPPDLAVLVEGNNVILLRAKTGE